MSSTPYLGGGTLVASINENALAAKEDKNKKGVANGYAPLDASSKVPAENLPDAAALDAEVAAAVSAHNALTTSVHGIADTANLVLTNDSRLSGIFEDSIKTTTADQIVMGPNGGTINSSNYGGSIDIGGFGGSISTTNYGGSINTSEHGGSIITGPYGGRIDTTGQGKIELGTLVSASGTTDARTTLLGSASVTNKTITFPNQSGTVSLEGHKHAIADVTNLQTELNNKQASGSYATLVAGKVPSDQLPSYVDDVLEFANNATFPETGETGKIYVSLATNKTFRWSGSAYIEISPSEVTSVNTKTGAVTLTPEDIGAQPAGSYATAAHSHEIYDVNGLQGIASDSIKTTTADQIVMGPNGGTINSSNYGGSITMAGYAGSINTGGYGGSINTSGFGGQIFTGSSGGSIFTGPQGGSINTTGQGQIQLGNYGTRTTLTGSNYGGGDKTITFPNQSGTISLEGHKHAIADVTNLEGHAIALALALG